MEKKSEKKVKADSAALDAEKREEFLENYLSILEEVSAKTRSDRTEKDSEEVKTAIRGFRQSLVPPLDLAELAAKLKVDIRAAKNWEEKGLPPNDGALAKFRDLLEKSVEKSVVQESPLTQVKNLVDSPKIGFVLLEELLKNPKLEKIVVCTCGPLRESIPGSDLRIEVLSSMQRGVQFTYIFPDQCSGGKEETKNPPEKSIAAKEFIEFENSLPPDCQDKLKGLPKSWDVGLFATGVMYLICQTEPDNGKPEGKTTGYIYVNVEFAELAFQEGLGFVCVKMGPNFYETFMKRLQVKVGTNLFN